MNLLTSPRIPSLNTTLGTNAFQRWAFDDEAMSSPNHNTGVAVYPHCLWGKSCLSWCHFFFSFHKPVCLSSLVSVISSLCWILVPWLPMGVTRNPPPSLPFPSLPSLFYLTSHQIYSWISTHRSSSRVSFGNFFHCKTFFFLCSSRNHDILGSTSVALAIYQVSALLFEWILLVLCKNVLQKACFCFLFPCFALSFFPSPVLSISYCAVTSYPYMQHSKPLLTFLGLRNLRAVWSRLWLSRVKLSPGFINLQAEGPVGRQYPPRAVDSW